MEGKDLTSLDNEGGGHRIQRIPPTEKRGRVHTSTVVVAVVKGESKYDPRYDLREKEHFQLEWFSGNGAGGQNRNKHQNCARLIHLPTGIVRVAQTRDRTNSERLAREALFADLDQKKAGEAGNNRYLDIHSQFGSGQRGDKIRTYRFQDDITTDHRTGKKASTSKVMRGRIDLLWSD